MTRKPVIIIRYNPDIIKNNGKIVNITQSNKIDLLVKVIKEELIKVYDEFIVKIIQICYNDNYIMAFVLLFIKSVTVINFSWQEYSCCYLKQFRPVTSCCYQLKFITVTVTYNIIRVKQSFVSKRTVTVSLTGS